MEVNRPRQRHRTVDSTVKRSRLLIVDYLGTYLRYLPEANGGGGAQAALFFGWWAN